MNANKSERHQELTLEIMLVLVTAAISCLLYHTESMKVIVLNLFYLPIVLAGFFLGRYRAGVLALLAVVTATIVICMDFTGFGTMNSPVAIGLTVTLWGSVLGLTALLVGTLCDDRDARRVEAHEAQVGVVEVLSRYLQSANPALETRAKRVASLSEQVARKMRLSSKEIDDIRVAALLIDMENIEITARVIKKAVGAIEDDSTLKQRTFHGTELVQSLGTVLTGAFPLLLNTSEESAAAEGHTVPFGSRIIRTVRAYEAMESDPWQHGDRSPESFIDELQTGIDCEHHPAVLHALRLVVSGKESTASASANPAT
ncbi:MAG TPA: HD domain-containing phosphohydrolase [Caulifigura sp.]|nr:HD domain-containing phosphohydrolase [Caulifigura sp.]